MATGLAITESESESERRSAMQMRVIRLRLMQWSRRSSRRSQEKKKKARGRRLGGFAEREEKSSELSSSSAAANNNSAARGETAGRLFSPTALQRHTGANERKKDRKREEKSSDEGEAKPGLPAQLPWQQLHANQPFFHSFIYLFFQIVERDAALFDEQPHVYHEDTQAGAQKSHCSRALPLL